MIHLAFISLKKLENLGCEIDVKKILTQKLYEDGQKKIVLESLQEFFYFNKLNF